MMAWEPPYRGAHFTLTGSLATSTTPPSTIDTYPTITTPLILRRDWPDNYYLPSTSDPLCDNYDFQSNHLETSRLPSGIIPSLAGLGIKNVDLDKDPENNDITFSPYSLDGLYAAPPQDSRRHSHRNYRTDSVYDVIAEYDDLNAPQPQQSGFIPELNSPWSLSAVLRAAGFSADNAVTSEIGPRLTSGPELDASALTSQLLNGSQLLEEGSNWSFEKLSAATGLSVADFAAQISATAETTLRRMGVKTEIDGSTSLSLGTAANYNATGSFRGVNESLTWPATERSGLPLPLVDINMRSLDITWDMNCIGVNPADILSNSQDSLPVSQSPSPLAHNTSGDLPVLDDFIDNIPSQVTFLPTFEFDLDQSILRPDPGSPYQGPYTLPLLKHTSRNMHKGSDEEAFQSPSSSEYSPNLQPLGSKRNHPSRAHRGGRVSKNIDPVIASLEYQNDVDQQHLPPINLGTPVFDAHRGIDIEELKAKAERYRLRNQGREYDKRWLIAFAGKLTVKGELLDEFRCYVEGCKQVNKRRDHILIHVGAHLDQRPFKCLHCTARFLRKNECKRHELSHTGIRPFSCHLCPVPATTFVRQDLLKRHMKRTHRQDIKSDKENDEPIRPKKRARARY